MKATAKDLRFYSKELLETVARGEEVIITYHGKPCAKLVPVSDQKEMNNDSRQLFGIWRDREEVEDVNQYIRDLRKGRF